MRKDLEEPLLLPCAEEVPTLQEQVEEEQDTVAIIADTTNSASPPAQKSFRASLALLLVSVLFATLNVSLRYLFTMDHPATPLQVNSIRQWFTVLFFLPLLAARKRREEEDSSDNPTIILPNRRPLWIAAVELALWNFGGQMFVSVGLMTTPSARVAFLGQTVIVLVPLLCVAIGGREAALRKQDLLGCLCSMIGVLLLSTTPPGTHSGSTSTASSLFHLHFGDVWILASAVAFSCYLIRMGHLARHYDEVFLQGIKNIMIAVLYAVWVAAAFIIAQQQQSEAASLLPQWAKSSWIPWALLAWCAFGPGCSADLLQQKAQEIVSPNQSNLILCSSSVFSAILSRVLLGEETSWLEKLGGTFLIAGAIVAGSM